MTAVCVQITSDQLVRIFEALAAMQLASVIFVCFWVWSFLADAVVDIRSSQADNADELEAHIASLRGRDGLR